MRINIRRAGVGVAVAALGLALASISLCDVLVVRGISMENTLKDGDRLLVIRADVLAALPPLQRLLLKKGRIVAFRSPLRAEELFVKRIVATEGDTVNILHADLMVNDRVVPVAKTVIPIDRTWPPVRDGQVRKIRIPHGHYFVLSDNRLQELDSRTLGPVTPNMIVAVVIGVVSHEANRPDWQTAMVTPPASR